MFCKEMGWTYTEFRRQPARVVRRWSAMLAARSRAMVKRQEIEENLAKTRRH